MILKKEIILLSSILFTLGLSVSPAYADSVSIDFESGTYTTGSINGQDGWSSLGSIGSGCAVYDHAVASQSTYPSFGGQSLRMSDSVTSGCFGDQTFAKPLVDSVGETAATANSFSTGTKQRRFEAQFDIASKVPGAQQSGMHVSVSPDRGDGSRMSYLRFEDGSTGIDVYFSDVQGTSNPANFVETQIASGLNRAVPHKVKISMDMLDGASNDVVKVYIDNTLVHTGTSWENYYRYDSSASAEQSPRIIKTLLWRSAGTANLSNAGNGFLFDNVSLYSGPIPPAVSELALGTTASTTSNTTGNFGSVNLPVAGDVCIFSSLMLQNDSSVKGMESHPIVDGTSYPIWGDVISFTGAGIGTEVPKVTCIPNLSAGSHTFGVNIDQYPFRTGDTLKMWADSKLWVTTDPVTELTLGTDTTTTTSTTANFGSVTLPAASDVCIMASLGLENDSYSKGLLYSMVVDGTSYQIRGVAASFSDLGIANDVPRYLCIPNLSAGSHTFGVNIDQFPFRSGDTIKIRVGSKLWVMAKPVTELSLSSDTTTTTSTIANFGSVTLPTASDVCIKSSLMMENDTVSAITGMLYSMVVDGTDYQIRGVVAPFSAAGITYEVGRNLCIPNLSAGSHTFGVKMDQYPFRSGDTLKLWSGSKLWITTYPL